MMSNLTKRQNRIARMWGSLEASEPDISTERLLATISGAIGCDDSDVVDALIKSGHLKEATP